MDEAKIKALDGVMAQIEKQYGKGAIMRLGQDAAENNVEVLPTGCLSLDLAIGVGGLPRGRIIEIYGPESSGKTTVALHVIAEAQKLGGIAAFVDAEHALDPTYAKALVHPYPVEKRINRQDLHRAFSHIRGQEHVPRR